MTVSEQRFMEQVPGALLRIATALEGINEKLELLAQRQEEPATVTEPAPQEDDTIDYDELLYRVDGMKCGGWPAKKPLASALYHRPKFVNKTCAVGLACCYSGVTNEQMKEAIDNGDIEAYAPEKRDVEYTQWKGNQRVKAVRTQGIGNYQISLKGALLWLESHGIRQLSADDPVNKCIEKIIKQ